MGQGTRKAGAYGGSELGSRLGGAVGPPIIGGIVGSLAGEVVGEKVVKETGVDKKVKEAGDQLASVIGRRQVKHLWTRKTNCNYSTGEQVGRDDHVCLWLWRSRDLHLLPLFTC